MEIDARGGTFQAFELFGQQLLQNNHYASDEVRGKLEELADARQNLEKLVLFLLFLSNLFEDCSAFLSTTEDLVHQIGLIWWLGKCFVNAVYRDLQKALNFACGARSLHI